MENYHIYLYLSSVYGFYGFCGEHWKISSEKSFIYQFTNLMNLVIWDVEIGELARVYHYCDLLEENPVLVKLISEGYYSATTLEGQSGGGV